MSEPTVNNLPLATWKNPRWAGTPEWARPIFMSLQEFLARPTFYSGIQIGDGDGPKKDPETGVVEQPELVDVDKPFWDEMFLPKPPDAETLARLDGMDAEAANMAATMAQLEADLAEAMVDVDNLKTSPIAFTRITDVSISTPMLQANAVTAIKIASDQIIARHILAGEITTAKLDVNAVTANKLAAVYLSVGKFIRSANYNGDTNSNGTQGWAIGADGNAVFNNITIRNAANIGGTVDIGSFYVSSTGIVGGGANSGGSGDPYAGDWWVANSGSAKFNSVSLNHGGTSTYFNVGTVLNAAEVRLTSGPRLVVGSVDQLAVYSENGSMAATQILCRQFLSTLSGTNNGGFVNLSDARLKRNVTDMDMDFIAAVKAAPLHDFDMLQVEHMEDLDVDNIPQDAAYLPSSGWIAQEAPASAVVDVGNGTLGVSLGGMVHVNWGATAALIDRVEALEQQIATMETA
jgi:hypothetical protein